MLYQEENNMTKSIQKITPFLWFDNQAEEAVNFYISVFNDSKIVNVTRYSEGGRGPVGGVMTITFELAGQEFTALNGGPHFKFNESISFVVNCESQDEVDEMWEKLSHGGGKVECGWIKDKFGVSWQIVPKVLFEMLNDPDPSKSQRVMQALLKMNKIEIKTLVEAYEQ
jgi:predicted 3-demethylubiquinone-9 3-methyltransferase (glyoxalase superfamily)